MPGNLWNRQIEFNRSTAGLTSEYESHRRQLTAFLANSSAANSKKRLAVLGAGNGNDLDFAQMAKLGIEPHLFDFDAQALDVATVRARNASCPVRCFALDLTGISSAVGTASLTVGDLAVEPQSWLSADCLGSYDLVLSTCVLSQLIFETLESFGATGQSLEETETYVKAIRSQHISVMCALLDSGGCGLLATDFLSSETCPVLNDQHALEVRNLTAVCAEAIRNGNFFTGCNPMAVHRMLKDTESIREAKLSTPWLWSIGSKVHAVVLHSFRKP